jgi:hypothetical protein
MVLSPVTTVQDRGVLNSKQLLSTAACTAFTVMASTLFYTHYKNVFSSEEGVLKNAETNTYHRMQSLHAAATNTVQGR